MTVEILAHHLDDASLPTKLEYIWRIAVISLGAFTIGFAIYIGWLYQRGNLHSEVYGRGRHVTFISLSYILLVAELITEISYRAIRSEPITWRLPVATVAFVLGSWALLQLLRAGAHRPRESTRGPGGAGGAGGRGGSGGHGMPGAPGGAGGAGGEGGLGGLNAESGSPGEPGEPGEPGGTPP